MNESVAAGSRGRRGGRNPRRADGLDRDALSDGPNRNGVRNAGGRLPGGAIGGTDRGNSRPRRMNRLNHDRFRNNRVCAEYGTVRRFVRSENVRSQGPEFRQVFKYEEQLPDVNFPASVSVVTQNSQFTVQRGIRHQPGEVADVLGFEVVRLAEPTLSVHVHHRSRLTRCNRVSSIVEAIHA